MMPVTESDIAASFVAQPGLYIHVPFCQSICPFCPYNKTLFKQDLTESYFTALQLEASRYIGHLSKPFTSLYIGGGTPTLCLDDLACLLEEISFEGECGIEVLPNHATAVNVDKMLQMGVNYISLGAQSFNDEMLHYLGRANKAADNYRALENLTGRFDCIDVDLIFDVAFDQEEIFLNDAVTCFKAGVEQLSTYPLMRFGYAPFGKKCHYPRFEHEVLEKLAKLAGDHGYERRSVWTFNRIGTPNYTSITREFYLGIGAGAASYTGTSFLVNHFGLEPYLKKLEEGVLPVARCAELGEFKSALYYLFWQCYTGAINLRRAEDCLPATRLLFPIIKLLAWAGQLRIEGESARLTQQGYNNYHDLERWVTYRFIEPLWEDLMLEHGSASMDITRNVRLGGRFWRHLANIKPVHLIQEGD